MNPSDKRIAELKAQRTKYKEIARRLNMGGFRNGKGQPWTETAVRNRWYRICHEVTRDQVCQCKFCSRRDEACSQEPSVLLAPLLGALLDSNPALDREKTKALLERAFKGVR